MGSRAKTEYRYEKLTWPEINDAVDLGKVCILPCGAVEQHGHHLPLDVDLVCPGGIARGAGQALADKILVLPTICYGYTGHVMDFPGTINSNYTTFMEHVLDVTKSLAYHGFKKIILLNGHGSNMPNLDLFAAGPATVVSWTSGYSETGVLGEAELATKEKGERAYDEAVKQLCNFVNYFHPRPKAARRELHRKPPTIPIPWKQRSQAESRE